jgi:hypothetical protein
MQLTTAQQTTLRNFVLADPVFSVQPQTNSGALFIAEALNQPTEPAFIVWRTSVSVDEIMRNGIDWARVDNLSVGKARIWDWMSRLGSFDASKPNVRAGIDACWVGTAADLAVRASVYVHCKRTANGVEKLLATGTGSNAVPAVASAEGTLSYLDVVQAMGWFY